jgi:TetR/AcrR family transcriptional regulator, transcriptional repressor for nem operon
MARGLTKDVLLEVGRKMFLERGYNHAGIECILQAACVPKGSFYNYFSSKEDFGLQVIDSFAACHDAFLDTYLGDHSRSPLDRLRGYFNAVVDDWENGARPRGCLVGQLSQELAEQSEAFRARLESIFERWADRFAKCLAEARDASQIAIEPDVRPFADFLLNSWQGALMRAKSSRSTVPLQTFIQNTMERIALSDGPVPPT